MKTRIARLFLMLVIVLAAVGSAQAQSASSAGASIVEALKAALAAGRYLTACDQVFMLNDSAPAARNAIVAGAPQTEADAQARVFVLLFSGQVDKAMTDAQSLPKTAFLDVIKAAGNDLQGNAHDSATALTRALKAAPDAAQVYGLMAASAFARGAAEPMLQNSTRALEIDPKLASAYRLRGIAEMYSGDPQAALKDAEQALALDPSVYFFHYLRASTQFALGDPAAALTDIDAALALAPKSVIGHALRSRANMALGKPEQAALDFAQSVEVRTTDLITGKPLTADTPSDLTMTFGTTFHLPFEAKAGQMLTASVTSVNDGEVDPVVLVLSPEGIPLAFNDDSSDNSMNATIPDYPLPENGTYMLVISHANGGSEGNIRVTLALTPSPHAST